MKTSDVTTNTVFGRLTVLEQDFTKKTGHRYWNCLCFCGKNKTVREDALINKRTESCGCLHREVMSNRTKDLSGQVFNMLTIISRDLSLVGVKREIYWICKCQCGKVKSVLGRSVTRGTTKSCGCLTRIKAMHRVIPNGGADRRSWIGKYIRRARKLGIDFTLTDEQFFELCSQNCFYCNDSPEHRSHGYTPILDKGKFFANGIDRVNPDVGYVLDNCVACCKICNFMKTNKNQEDFIGLVCKIANNVGRKNVN